MNEMPVTPSEEPKKSNTGLIIGIVVVVLLCCCCAFVAGGWCFGDNGRCTDRLAQFLIQIQNKKSSDQLGGFFVLSNILQFFQTIIHFLFQLIIQIQFFQFIFIQNSLLSIC